jgi:adenylosuccinate lyase
MAGDLDANWEVLGEPVQTVMRALAAQGYPDMENPYERLKEHTRGRRQGRQELAEFIDGLGVPDDVRNTLLALTPASYVGLASTLVADHLD